MPNVNAKESTSPPNGGNVDELYKTPSPVYKSSSNQKINLPDGSHLKTDVNPDGQQLDPSTQTYCNAKERCPTSLIDRERIIKDLGVTSSAFIGPACRPKPSLEKELSEFYKELDEVDQEQVSDETDTKPAGVCPPESGLQTHMNIPVVITDHSRSYRPYPDPYERSQRDPKRWRPRLPQEPWYVSPPPPLPPPPWVPPDPRVHFFPPPTSGGPEMYPPDMLKPREDFHSLHACNNNSWGPWRGPPVPSDRWYEPRGFQSHERPGFSVEHQTPLAHWQQHDYENEQYQKYDIHNALVLVLLRGVPGSGKSTLARELLSTGPNGVVLSTDDYFFQDNRYAFDSALLGDAHDWNQKRAEQAMLDGCSPVIIDNTNVKAWEMKPYVELALENGYRVDFLEPDTRWKCDPTQLEKRNKHGVPRDTIAKMLDGFERPMNVDIVMNSVVPPHKSKPH